MGRLRAGSWLLLIFVASVYAQSTPAEAPMEQASPVTIVLFLVLFLGGILGYVGYTWWRGRKDQKNGSGG
jgi:hypothetical protein